MVDTAFPLAMFPRKIYNLYPKYLQSLPVVFARFTRINHQTSQNFQMLSYFDFPPPKKHYLTPIFVNVLVFREAYANAAVAAEHGKEVKEKFEVQFPV